MNKVALVTVCISIFTSQAYAQSDPAEICRGILSDAGRNISVSQESDAVLGTVFDKYCNQSGTIKNSSLDIAASAVIEEVPASFTLGSTDKQTAFNNFCRNYAQIATSNRQKYSYQSTVVSKALDTLDQCVRIARTGNFLTHKLLNDEAADISLVAQAGGKITLQGLYVTGDVKCQTKLANTEKAVILSPDSSPEFAGNLVISCRRTGVAAITSPNPAQPATASPGLPVGSTLYNEATVTLGTVNVGSYSFLWPRSVRLPENEASQINADLVALKIQIQSQFLSSSQQTESVRMLASSVDSRLKSTFRNRSDIGRCQMITVDSPYDYPSIPPSFVNNGDIHGAVWCPINYYVAGLGNWKGEFQAASIVCCPQ